jgi:hypothetical protein
MQHRLTLRPLRVRLQGIEEGVSIRLVLKQPGTEALFTRKYTVSNSYALLQEELAIVTKDLALPLELTLLVCFLKIRTPEIVGAAKILPSKVLGLEFPLEL